MSRTEQRLALSDESVLLARYAERPDPLLEAELTARFMPLAASLAYRYRGRSEQDEDLKQVANIALVKALRRYDPAVGRRFISFAAPTILGELKRHFRDYSWRVKVPRGLQENSLAVDRATDDLVEELGRSPTMEQIAMRAGVDVEDVIEALDLREAQRSTSLDLPLYSDETDSETVGDSIGRDDSGFDYVEAQFAVESCSGVEATEREAIELRFEHGMTQLEIAQRLGVSQMQVSRIMRRGLAKMLEAVQGDEAPDGRRSLEETRPDPRFPEGRSRARVPRAANPA